MALSTHKVEVVNVTLERHPNAESLSIAKIFGYTVVVRTEDWLPGHVWSPTDVAGIPSPRLGAYVTPDSLVDTTRPEFSWLGDHPRIRVKKLRGVVSQGLLIVAPPGSAIGDDVSEQLGVTHYEPPSAVSTGGENVPAPSGFHPVYDIESIYRYPTIFQAGEPVLLSEKLDGASARFCFSNGQFYVGSHRNWKAESGNIWWQVVATNPGLRAFCEAHPDCTLYGEVYGPVQSLKYGQTKPQIAIFDILRGDQWLNPNEALGLIATFKNDQTIGEQYFDWVPIIAINEPFDFNKIAALANGPSRIAGATHIREGIVVRPMTERTHPEIGRVLLKAVSNEYLEQAK